MTDAQIKHMVERFLGWRLPEDFHPDAGISFKAEFNEHTAHPMKHEPTGTNLLDYTQAEAMVRHMLDGLIDGPVSGTYAQGAADMREAAAQRLSKEHPSYSAAIRSLPLPDDGWCRDMERAPRDGTVEVWSPSKACVIAVCFEYEAGNPISKTRWPVWRSVFGGHPVADATHWRLPTPPATTESGDE